MPEELENEKKKEYNLHPLFGTQPLDEGPSNPVTSAVKFLSKVIDGPTVWFRENIVEKYRGPSYPYYHRKFHRAPTIEQCYTDDYACIFEADEQFKRDRKVDFEIIKILRNRYFKCHQYNRITNEFHDVYELCTKERKDLEDAEYNLFLKYGEIGAFSSVVDAFMRQKHRLIWERRQKEKENNPSLADD